MGKYPSFTIAPFQILLLSLCVSSCSYNHEKDGGSPSPQYGTSNTPGNTPGAPDYATVRDRIFTPKCIGCHGAGGHSPELDNYDSIKGSLTDIQTYAMDRKEMPPRKPLPDDLQKLLGAWITAGAPETTAQGPATPPSPTPSPVLIPLAPTYTSIRANIFVDKCLTCHKAGSFAEDVPLDTYDSALNEVDVGNPSGSDLYKAITNSDPKKRMPPAVSGKILSATEIQTISDWISQGAPE